MVLEISDSLCELNNDLVDIEKFQFSEILRQYSQNICDHTHDCIWELSLIAAPQNLLRWAPVLAKIAKELKTSDWRLPRRIYPPQKGFQDFLRQWSNLKIFRRIQKYLRWICLTRQVRQHKLIGSKWPEFSNLWEIPDLKIDVLLLQLQPNRRKWLQNWQSNLVTWVPIHGNPKGNQIQHS